MATHTLVPQLTADSPTFDFGGGPVVIGDFMAPGAPAPVGSSDVGETLREASDGLYAEFVENAGSIFWFWDDDDVLPVDVEIDSVTVELYHTANAGSINGTFAGGAGYYGLSYYPGAIDSVPGERVEIDQPPLADFDTDPLQTFGYLVGSKTYTLNPFTGLPWTRAELFPAAGGAGAWGMGIDASGVGSYYRADQFRLVVTYVGEEPGPLIGDYIVRRDPAISIHDVLNDAPNYATFKVDGSNVVEPQPGAQVTVIDPAANERIFKGSVQRVDQNYEERTDQLQLAWDVSCIDSTWLLNRRRPFGRFVDTSISVIAETILDAYAPEFTHDHVQQDLAAVSITFDGSEDMATALTRLCQLGGPHRWYVDYDDDVHVFYDTPPPLPSNNLPGPTTQPTVTITANPPDFTFAAGWYLFRTGFVYSDGRASALGPMTDPIYLDGTLTVDVDDIEVGAPYGSLTVTKRRVYVRQLLGNATVDMRRNILWANVDDNVTTLLPDSEPNAIAGVVYGPADRQPNPPPTAPTPAFTAALSSTTPAVGATPNGVNLAFKMVYVYRNGVESPAGPASNTIVGDGVHGTTFTSVPLGPTFGSYDVVYRKVYYSLAFTGTPDFKSGHTGGWHYELNNSLTTFDDVKTLSPLDFRTFTEMPLPDAHVNGPDLEGDTPDPEDLTDDSVYLLKDPPITSSIDNSQIRTRVYVRGQASPTTADAVATDTTLDVADASIFSPDGGQIFVGWMVLVYTSISGNTITLADPLDEDVPTGTQVHVWVQRDDVAAQSDLAAVEGGTGIHEYVVDMTDVSDLTRLEERGDAELQVFSRGVFTVRYATRDPNTRSGKTININLTNPPLVTTLKIQTVDIDQVHDADGLLPRRRVSASNARFNIDDFLRRVQLTR